LGTKEKILQIAIAAFNENGFGAVSMQSLANELNISRGNLTYHFKNKDELLSAIADVMWNKFEKEKAKSRNLPSFENLHKEVRLIYEFQREFAFVFLDARMAGHPQLKNSIKKMQRYSEENHKMAIAFSIQLGNMKAESIPGTYNSLSYVIWLLSTYCLFQKVSTGEKTIKEVEKTIWSLILPHMTKKGHSAFKKYFGLSYFKQIGEDFNKKNVKADSFF